MEGTDSCNIGIWQLSYIEQSAGQNVSVSCLNSAVPDDGFDLGRNMDTVWQLCNETEVIE
jgi:hypothetical protein